MEWLKHRLSQIHACPSAQEPPYPDSLPVFWGFQEAGDCSAIDRSVIVWLGTFWSVTMHDAQPSSGQKAGDGTESKTALQCHESRLVS